MCFQKRKSALVGFFFEKNPMTNKIKKFLYTLEHLIPDGRDEIPTFALYHPLLALVYSSETINHEEGLLFIFCGMLQFQRCLTLL